MSELDPRKQAILRAIVVEYVSQAEPIASEALVQKYDLGVRSATVRNEMAELSELGMLEQPHTSAGRVPSDLGYRFYVDRLVEVREPDSASKSAIDDASDEGEALQELLRETIRSLSRMTHLLGVATTARDTSIQVRTAIVSALGPARALLVVAFGNGHVENRMIECPTNLSLEDVGRLNETLQREVIGQDVSQLSRLKLPISEVGSPRELLALTVWNQLIAIGQELSRGKVFTEGEEFLLGQPEFRRDPGAFAELLRQLYDGDALYRALYPSASSQPAPISGTGTVTIGKENTQSELQKFSVVRSTYFVGNNEAGVIALVGPTRMAYDKSIPLVNFTAEVLSESLTKFFG